MKLALELREVQTLADTIRRIRDSYFVGRKKKGTSPNAVFQKIGNLMKNNLKRRWKDDHLEDIFIPDAEEESVDNNTGSGTDFL